jgi:hypothetical protein
VPEGSTITTPRTDPLVVELMIIVTRYYMPYFRLYPVEPEDLPGGRCYLQPFAGFIVYNKTLPRHERYAVVSTAIHRLWEERHRHGLSEFQTFRRRLSAVS